MTKSAITKVLIGTGILAGVVHLLQGKEANHNSASAEGRTIHWARWYDPMVQLFTLGKADEFRKMTADLADIRPGMRVLDIGCGTGDLTYEISKRVGPDGAVFGIDAASEMVELANEKYGNSAEFRHAPVENMPFEDDSFDLVISSLVLHHLPENLKRAGIAESMRVLKPGGRFYSVDFAASKKKPLNLHARLHQNESDNGESSVHQLKAVLRNSGFNDVASGQTSKRFFAWLSGTKPLSGVAP